MNTVLLFVLFKVPRSSPDRNTNLSPLKGPPTRLDNHVSLPVCHCWSYLSFIRRPPRLHYSYHSLPKVVPGLVAGHFYMVLIHAHQEVIYLLNVLVTFKVPPQRWIRLRERAPFTL